MKSIHAPTRTADISAALFAAQGFILGFENDPDQDGIDDLLMLIEKAQQAARGEIPVIGTLKDSRYFCEARYQRLDGTLKGWYSPGNPRMSDEAGRWAGVENVTDSLSREYGRLTFAVIDDFGNLVEVAR